MAILSLPGPEDRNLPGPSKTERRGGESATRGNDNFIDVEFEDVEEENWQQRFRNWRRSFRSRFSRIFSSLKAGGRNDWRISIWNLVPIFLALWAVTTLPTNLGIGWGALLAFLTTVLYFSLVNVQISSPDVGFLQWKGQVETENADEDEELRLLNPGIYVPIPILGEIIVTPMTEHQIHFADPHILTQDRYGLTIGGMVRIQANPGHPKFLEVSLEDDVMPIVQGAALAELQLRMTQDTAMEWLSKKRDLSELIRQRVVEELRGTSESEGIYRVHSVQISEINADVIADAKARLERGLAEAEVADAMTKAMGDNAYKVQQVAELGSVVQLILRTWFSERREDRRTSGKDDTPSDLVKEAVDLFVKKLKEGDITL